MPASPPGLPGTADRLVTDLLARTTGPDRGVLLVTHRLAPLDAADEVLVLRGGHVAARGTHARLIAADADYREAHAAEQDDSGTGTTRAWPTT